MSLYGKLFIRFYTALAIQMLLLLAVDSYGQDSIDRSIIARIRREAFVHSEVMDIAFHLTDVSGPRLSNSPGLFRAQQWAMSIMRSWGLKRVTLEPWGCFGQGWELKKCYLAMTYPYYESLIAYPNAWSGGSHGPFSAEVVLYHPRDSNEQAALRGKVRGKLLLYATDRPIKLSYEPETPRYSDSELLAMTAAPVVIPPPVELDTGRRLPPRQISPLAKMVSLRLFAQQEGVRGVLFSRPENKDGTVLAGDSGNRNWKDSLGPMYLQLFYEGFHQLERLSKAGVPVTIEGEVSTHSVLQDSLGYNVLGEIPGADPKLKDQVVILGAHLDSWQSATGATDNAAGCAVMLEAVRILTVPGIHPRRTIRIILWSGEEEGLMGSRGYVKRHFGDPEKGNWTREQAKVSAYYNLDNGTGRIRGIYLQGDTAAGPVFRRWLKPFRDLAVTTVSPLNTGGTDHVSFVNAGIPGFQFIQDPIEYENRTHHTNMDTYDHLLPDDLKQAAAIIAFFAYQTAMREELIPRAAPSKMLPN